jgi:hypothetical protein
MFGLPITSGLKPKIIAVIIIGIIIFLFVGQQSINTSPKFIKAKEYIESNKEVTNSIGDITGYGFFVSHVIEKDERHSYIGIKVTGTKRTAVVRVIFNRNENGEWLIDHLELKN